ncbi:MAG: ATP synthase F1 subunit gamma [Peptococcaceae bacterium]|jgi:F-type H+-transporting ATPase subunit gamma|nr:ATP synthase F1 subunit gamma [Peptococcaceae bacterium]
MNTNAIRNRMKSVRQTLQITNAQKLIAASRIGKAKQMLAQSQPYHDHILETIAGVLLAAGNVSNAYLEHRIEPKKRGFLVLSADKGLAGGYNHNIIKLAEQVFGGCEIAKLLTIGHMARNQLTAAGYPVDETFDFSAENPTMFTAREISEWILRLFEQKQVDAFDVIYTKYYSAVRLTPVVERVLPIQPEALGEPLIWPYEMAFEPNANAVVSILIPKYLKGYIYGCLVHGWACELASRVAAMDSAIKNGGDMLERLSLQYNRARQAAITQEITEIVAGASSI